MADRRGAIQPRGARSQGGREVRGVRGDAAAARLRRRGGRGLRHLAARRHPLELPEHLQVGPRPRARIPRRASTLCLSFSVGLGHCGLDTRSRDK